jgi:hypothetical protein
LLSLTFGSSKPAIAMNADNSNLPFDPEDEAEAEERQRSRQLWFTTRGRMIANVISIAIAATALVALLLYNLGAGSR